MDNEWYVHVMRMLLPPWHVIHLSGKISITERPRAFYVSDPDLKPVSPAVTFAMTPGLNLHIRGYTLHYHPHPRNHIHNLPHMPHMPHMPHTDLTTLANHFITPLNLYDVSRLTRGPPKSLVETTSPGLQDIITIFPLHHHQT